MDPERRVAWVLLKQTQSLHKLAAVSMGEVPRPSDSRNVSVKAIVAN